MFLELTRGDGKVVHVNMDQVQFMMLEHDRTRLVFGGEMFFHVKETPSYISRCLAR